MEGIAFLISLEEISQIYMKNNINQIYHTSHCGSTLMATLLANSTVVYCEPPWTSNLLNLNKKVNLKVDNVTIKFASGLCPYSKKLSKNLSGKKVFLYRKLNHHLFKIKSSNYIDKIDVKYERHLEHCHRSLKELNFKIETDLEKIAFMWMNNVQWMKDLDNVLWVEANSFFENKKETMDKVCDHFNLNRIKNYDLSNFYVKSFGLIGKEKSINETEIPNLGQVKTLYPSFGVIEDYLCDQDSEISDIVSSIQESIDIEV
jgi:hypothetical protein